MAAVPVQDTVAIGGKATAAWANSDVRDAVNFLLNPPRCLAYQGTGATSLATGTLTTLALDAETFDSDAMHSTVTANSRLTVVTAGMYLLTGGVSFTANATGFRESAIYKNGVLAVRSIVPAAATGTTVVPVHALISAIAGDYFELGAAQASGSALSTTVGPDATWLSALWVASS